MKLSGGVVGKTITLLIVLCITVAAVSIAVGLWWLVLILMLPTIGIVFYGIRRCLDFAEANPQAAIMEGSELLIHERLVHGMKDQEEIIPDKPIIDHSPPPMDDEKVESHDQPIHGELTDSSNSDDTEEK